MIFIHQFIVSVIVFVTVFYIQDVHTFKAFNNRAIYQNTIISDQKSIIHSDTSLYAKASKKQKKSHPAVPEFSRVLNVGQVRDK
jgi:hypothetical protein